MKNINIKSAKLLLAALILVAANGLYLTTHVSAASLSNTYLRLNRMAAGQDSTMRLVFKTASAGATTLSINMNGADTTTWTGSTGTVSTTQAVTGVAGCDASATALPGTLAASGSGSTISVTGITALSATTVYCVDFTTATSVHNASANEYHPLVTVGSDSTTVAVRTVTNDQVVVSATVPPTFNLALSGNTDSFPSSLSTGSVGVTTGRTVTVNTNAKNGWFAWAYDSSTGLASASASHTIPSTTPGTAATLSAGTAEGYVFGITSITQGSGGGTTSAVAAYNSNGTTTGSGLDGTIRQIASSNGTANGAVLTVKELASITSTTQPATDYTDTITVIGAGYF